MGTHIKKVFEDYKVLLRNVPAFVTVAFVMLTFLMNTAASKVIFHAGEVAVTGGFLLSFAPFLCMDCTAKRFGARAAIMLNILSALGNVVAVIFLSIVAAIPTSDPYPEFNYIFGSVWFIVLSSTVAFVASGVVNSLLNAAIGKLFSRTSIAEFSARSFISTFVGQFIDNFLFLGLLYMVFAPIYWGTSLSLTTCLVTALLGGLLELLVEVIFGPLGYAIVRNWEKHNVGQEYIDLHRTDLHK